jgi:hypothetical protein
MIMDGEYVRNWKEVAVAHLEAANMTFACKD